VILIPTRQGIASRPTGTFPPLVEQKRYVLVALLKFAVSLQVANVLKHFALPVAVDAHGEVPDVRMQ